MHDWRVHAAREHPNCLLSVVIPAFNYADRLTTVLGSVINQMTNACELIVIDDGSTDDTLLRLQRFPVPDGLVVGFIHQANRGPGAARNHAIFCARGEWILPLDADDHLHPEALSRILQRLRDQPDIDCLLGGHEIRYESGRSSRYLPKQLPARPEQRVTGFLLSRNISMVHGAVVLSRRLLATCPYADQLRQGEDLPVFAYVLSREKINIIPHLLVTICKHPDSLRHATDRDLARAGQTADAVFNYLPSSYQQYRRRFEAQYLLSAFRRCYRAEEYAEASHLFRHAAALSPRQALRWRYLSKWLRLPFKSSRAIKGARA